MNKVDLKSLLNKVPNSPGVYKFKGEDGRILYVGKAKDLKKRVQNYFRAEKNRPVRTQKMIDQIQDFEWTVVGSDLEAIMLETNLIKEYSPKYNVLMKDDKNFVYIKITDETFPRIKIVRTVEKDGARYFGPKTAAHQCKKTLSLLQKLFMYRSCDLGMEWKDNEVKITKKTIAYPCLDYHIKRCAGPCINEVTPAQYQDSIDQIVAFLQGKTEAIEAKLKSQMADAVAAKNYEKAAQVRDRLLAIEDLMKSQIVTSSKLENMDVIAFVLNEGKAFFNLFQVREGKLINQENFIVEAPGFLAGDEPVAPEVLERFLYDYYQIAADIPALLLLPTALLEEDFFIDWLSQQSDHKVKIKVPERGTKDQLMELAMKNAESFFKQNQARWAGFENKEAELKSLQNILSLERLPKRIECFDISHLAGTDTVASMVVFENGKPKKSDYRKFNLRALVEGEIDDFKSMNEVLRRRLSYLSTSPGGLIIKQCTKKALTSMNELLAEWNHEPVKSVEHWTIALEEERVVGALGVTLSDDHRMALHTLFVTESWRGQGVARALLQFAIKKHKSKRVYVAPSRQVIEVYEHLGFEPIKTIPCCFKEIQESAQNRGDYELLALTPNKQKDESFDAKPDLIVIDGGKGQLNKALEARDHYSLDIPMIGLAKREEDIYQPGKSMPLLIPKESEALKLLQRVRDEAHRFAVGFQRNKRKKDVQKSILDDVPGLGKEKKMKLLRFFGSVDQIKQASDEALEKQVGPKLTAEIRKVL